MRYYVCERRARIAARRAGAERQLAIGLAWENIKGLTPELHQLVVELNYLRAVEKHPEAGHGDIVVAVVDGDCTIKRLEHRGQE